MTGLAIELEGVCKRFGDFEAVKEMSLQIRQGEFFSMLGPSGCGKTTTLRLIAGFEQPSEGAIKLDGVDVAHVPPYKRNVNTVFQSYALFEHLDVAENVAFGLRRRKVAKPEIEQRVGEALELVALGHRAKSRPGQLSGGQRQRVALARALVNRPSVLLLDEPLGALDLQLRKQMQVELKRIQREVGITFIYVTHDQEEALAMSDRIAVMHDGVVEQLGAPEEIYEHPRQAVRGRLHRHLEPAAGQGRERRRAARGRRGSSPATVPEGIAQGTEVQLSVRPEKLWIDELEPGMCEVEGTIAERVYLGTMTQIIVELGAGRRASSRSSRTPPARAPTTAGSWATASASAGSPRTARSCGEPRRPGPRGRPRRPRRRARPRGRRAPTCEVLEARDRPGGRVEQAVLDDGRVVQMGGEVVGSFHTAYLALAEELGMALERSYVAEPGAMSWDLVEGAGQGEWPPGFDAADIADAERIEAACVALAATVDPDDPWSHPDAAALDRDLVRRLDARAGRPPGGAAPARAGRARHGGRLDRAPVDARAAAHGQRRRGRGGLRLRALGGHAAARGQRVARAAHGRRPRRPAAARRAGHGAGRRAVPGARDARRRGGADRGDRRLRAARRARCATSRSRA